MADRNQRVEIRLTKAEENALMRKVECSGLTKSAFIRSVLNGAEIKELPPVDYFEVLKNLRQINNNMNQIAVKANSSGMVDAIEYRRNVDWLQQVVGNLMEAIYK